MDWRINFGTLLFKQKKTNGMLKILLFVSCVFFILFVLFICSIDPHTPANLILFLRFLINMHISYFFILQYGTRLCSNSMRSIIRWKLFVRESMWLTSYFSWQELNDLLHISKIYLDAYTPLLLILTTCQSYSYQSALFLLPTTTTVI